MTSPGAFDIVVVGGANFDYLVRGTVMPRPGDTVDADEFQEAPGGKGANQAVAAARLGAHTAMIARVGMDERGRTVIAGLIAEGVDTAHVVYDAMVHTGVALIMVDGTGQKQIMSAHGANHRLSLLDIQSSQEIIAAAKVLITQLEVPIKTTMEAMRVARAAGVRVILDAAPPCAVPDKMLAMVDLLRTNSAEAEIVSGMKITGGIGAHEAAATLMKRGVGAVMIEIPGEGNLLVWADGSELIAKVPVDSVDATGAGDALTGALAVALAEGRSMQDAGRFANAAAALATTAVGAQAGLPKRDALEELLASFR